MRIEVSDVAFRYEKETVVRDVNLVIPDGSLTIFCGQTGSGKSTLLQVLSGLEEPCAGTVAYAEPNPRQKIAVVFQIPETQIFAGTVREDIEYGLEMRKLPKAERASRTDKSLLRVGLAPESFLERSPYLLSGGEKRRVLIAGALALDPQVLVLDEPTAGLDPAACKELIDLLKQLREKGLTILVSTHDLDLFFPLADQVVMMNQGQVHFQGSARELVTHPDVLEQGGLEVPAVARIANRLQARGMPVATPLCVEELLAGLQVPDYDGGRAGSFREQEPVEVCLTESGEFARWTERWDWNFVRTSGSLVERLDPRVKWLGMVILSVALLQIKTLMGVVASVAMVLALIQMAEITWKQTTASIRPFLIMFLFLWVVSAVTFTGGDRMFGPVGISYEGAVRGGMGVLRFLLVIVLGFVFTETTTGVPLREGFEWGIRPLRKWNVPVRDLSMAVSIALQFVPWILDKVMQLRKALASRGQDTIGVRKWTPRQMALLIVPLLIIVIKMGDELAVAIESRGYNRQVARTSWYELRWTRNDTVACVLCVVVAGLLFEWG